MDRIQVIAKALCDSRVFETGQGGCAAICMDVLGDSRGGPHGYPHRDDVHASTTRLINARIKDHETKSGREA